MKYFILIASVILLVGCTADVNQPMWHRATEMCANNDGIGTIRSDGLIMQSLYQFDVVCRNGAHFPNVTVKVDEK